MTTAELEDRRLVTVLSPKGGTGKTTVATNLAVGLARRHPGDVLLVDLDLAFGDVAAALLLDVRRGIYDVEGGAGLAHVVLRHPSGLHVLGAPDDPTPTDTDAGDVVGRALDDALARYPLIVVDTGAGFDAATRAAAARATDLVLVASVDVPTVLALRKILRWLDGLGHTAARRHLVLNRADAGGGLDLADVVATVGMPVAIHIPSDPSITASVNDGHPVTETDGEGPVSDAFVALVALVDLPAPEPPPAVPGWIRRFLSLGHAPTGSG